MINFGVYLNLSVKKLKMYKQMNLSKIYCRERQKFRGKTLNGGRWKTINKPADCWQRLPYIRPNSSLIFHRVADYYKFRYPILRSACNFGESTLLYLSFLRSQNMNGIYSRCNITWMPIASESIPIHLPSCSSYL